VARKKTVPAEAGSFPPTQLAVTVVANPTDDTPSFYSNYAEASFNQHEIGLFFIKTPTKLDIQRLEEAKSGKLVLEPLAQVLIAPTLLPGLIRALQTVREEYEKAFGVIRDGGPNAK
jgi:hypothetical protein